MMICRNSFCCQFSSLSLGTSQSHEVKKTEVEVLLLGFKLSNCTLFTTTSSTILTTKATMNSQVKCSVNQSGQLITNSKAVERKMINKAGKREHHLWKRRDSAGSGQKALNLVRIVSGLPNEKESVYGALDKWTAWETEFPLIAAAKALRILRKRSQWKRVIQVFADMEELGVKPDQDTVRRVARAFQKLGQEEKQMLVLKRYQSKWNYVHFKGERVKVRTDVYDEDNA